VTPLVLGPLVDTEVVSASGPDLYGVARIGVTAEPGLHTEVIAVGGTREALLLGVGRTFRLDTVRFGVGLDLGMVRTELTDPGGATGGGELRIAVPASPTLGWSAGLEGIGGIGWRVHSGVAVTPAERLRLLPRLRAETFAGDRDVMLRVEMGLGARVGRTWLVVSPSVGGRDVLHMGPGVRVSLSKEEPW
jgi:hypothetical protein